jgi:hypothetical protein
MSEALEKMYSETLSQESNGRSIIVTNAYPNPTRKQTTSSFA